MLTIKYVPKEVVIEQKATVNGSEVRAIRLAAGFTSQMHVAEACGWSQASQFKYEKAGEHDMPLDKLLKMIRVCNGSE